MQIFNSYLEYSSQRPAAVTMGMFDGVHLGHQQVIKDLVALARQENLEAVVLTYWPHPRLYFNPAEKLKLLTTRQEKTDILKHLGVDAVIFQSFDEDFSQLTGEAFIEQVLVRKMEVRRVLVGYDHIFGRQRSGDFHLLERLSSRFGYQVTQTTAVENEGRAVSSTAIRRLLEEGKVKAAALLLGKAYALSGKVVKGRQLGRTLGFPTANLEVAPEKLLPKEGAYIVEAWLNGVRYPAMASIGTNPTVEGESFSVEVYLVDFSGDIYGEEMTVNFNEWLHPQIKFDGLESLKEKLQEDEAITRAYFS